MIKLDKEAFLRGYKVLPNQSYDLFLGAGASVNSGIPTGSELVWHFKREILNSLRVINGKKFSDLKIESNKHLIQSYFDKRGDNNIENEYSHYFKECYPDPLVRKAYLTELVRDKKPSIGFLCLSALVETGKLNRVWTTNFDDLIEKAITSLNYKSCQIVSPDNAGSVGNFKEDIPTVVKMHGDFRYDPLQNTADELQQLESALHDIFLKASQNKGLLVVGYSGSDNSIMQSIEKSLENANAFPNGLIWCIPRGFTPNKALSSLITKANEQNGRSGFMEIDGFDYFLFELYKSCEISNSQIDSITKERFDQKLPFRLTQNSPATVPILMNCIKALNFPKTVFSSKTKITGEGKWRKLKELVATSNIVASFGRGNDLWIFGHEQDIKNTLKDNIVGDLKITDIHSKELHNPDSFYWGMIYDLIEKSLINDYGFQVFARGRTLRKYYFTAFSISEAEVNDIKRFNRYFTISPNYDVFEAFELKVDFVDGELFALIIPTIHVQLKSGEEAPKLVAQDIANKVISNRFNGKYGLKLNWWINKLKEKNTDMIFKVGDFEVKLSPFYSTAAKKVTENIHCFNGFTKLSEPAVYFHYQDKSKQTIHPISGLKLMGTLEESYGQSSSKINLAIISPDFGFNKVKAHLDSLLSAINPTTEREYLKEYTGFDDIYKKQLIIPASMESEFVVTIPKQETENITAIQFYDNLKSKIDKLALKSTEIDCVVIYIPNEWARFRELKNENTYFDLHDSLKLYCVKKGITLQFIENKSITYNDQAKIRWWLSLGIYVKSNGTPWKVETESIETAFVGLGYAVRQNGHNKVVLGSSQIFDGHGNGLKFLLQPIEKPLFYNKNPFMNREDAFRLISNIRNTYHRIDPIIGMKKLVLHKTTHFTTAEIAGISNALEGIDNVELLQIQQFSAWRAIKLIKNINNRHEPFGYPIERGTIILLDDYSFLLWTHGVVESPELNGRYYQGKKGIPAPLLIRRFKGTDPIETVANDILKLTKMNWNGAELYKTFPVTIDFSKKLSVMGKQLEELGNKPYDFRFFI